MKGGYVSKGNLYFLFGMQRPRFIYTVIYDVNHLKYIIVSVGASKDKNSVEHTGYNLTAIVLDD